MKSATLKRKFPQHAEQVEVDDLNDVEYKCKLDSVQVGTVLAADKQLEEIKEGIRKAVLPYWLDAWKLKMFALADKVKFREIKEKYNFLSTRYSQTSATPVVKHQLCEVSFSSVIEVADSNHQFGRTGVRKSKREVRMEWAVNSRVWWTFSTDHKEQNRTCGNKVNVIGVQDIHLLRNHLYPERTAESGMPLNLFYTVVCKLLAGCNRFHGLNCEPIETKDAANKYPYACYLGSFLEPVNQLYILPQHFNHQLLAHEYPRMKSQMQPATWFDGRHEDGSFWNTSSNYLFWNGELRNINWRHARTVINQQQLHRIVKLLFSLQPEKLALAQDIIGRLDIPDRYENDFNLSNLTMSKDQSKSVTIISTSLPVLSNSVNELWLVWQSDESDKSDGWRRQLEKGTPEHKLAKVGDELGDLVDYDGTNLNPACILRNHLAELKSRIVIDYKTQLLQQPLPTLDDYDLLKIMEWFFFCNHQCEQDSSRLTGHEFDNKSCQSCGRDNDNSGENICRSFCLNRNFVDFGYPRHSNSTDTGRITSTSSIGGTSFSETAIGVLEAYEASFILLHKLLATPSIEIGADQVKVEVRPVLVSDVVKIICTYHSLTCPSPVQYNSVLASQFTKLRNNNK